MKHTFIITVFFMIPVFAVAQKNTTAKKAAKNSPKKIRIVWECIPKYDSLGNKFTTQFVFRHIPTQQDTLNYKKECGDIIKDVTGIKE